MRGWPPAAAVAGVGGLVVLAYGAAVGALALAGIAGSTPAWWPAAGVGLAAALVAPRRLWPALAVGLFAAYALANLTRGRDPVTAALLGLFDLVETGLGAFLLQRWLPRGRLEGIADTWKLLAAATVGAVAAALGIAATLAGLIATDFWSTVSIVVPAHVASVMLLTPLAMVPWRRVPLPRLELALQVALLVLCTVLAFGPDMSLAVGFVPLPLVVWAAVRFDERVVALEQAVFAVAVTLFTSYGWGPFNLSATVDGVGGANSTQLAQLYLVCVVLVGLPLAQAMRERELALTRISAGRRVFRRTFTDARTPVALVAWDGHRLRFEEVNAATSTLLGDDTEVLQGDDVSQVLVVDELVQALADPDLAGWSGRLGVVRDDRVRLDGILALLEARDSRTYFSLHLTDVTEPHQLQESLAAQRRYTRAVVDTASSVIVVTDHDGTVLAANPATTRLTGWSEHELVGRRFWETLIPEKLRPGISDQFSSPRTVPRQGESVLLAKDGTTRTVVFSNNVHQDSPDAPVLLVLTAIDVTDARESAGMVTHVLRSLTSIAFIGTDLAGRITLFNAGAERMLGLAADRAAGRPIVDFLGWAADRTDVGATAPALEERPTFADLTARSASGVFPDSRDWTVFPEGRTPLRVSVTGNPVATSFGQVFAHLFVARDITETRRSQEILVKALHREREVVARLKDLDRAKDDFVSTVSHELRTPMSSIIGSAEMLADGILGDLSPEQARMIDVIARNGDRLLALADDLLVLATFDRDAWPAQTVPVDLRDVVRESSEAVASLLDQRRLEVSYDLPGAALTVRGEAWHLERAVTNLLTNAVKFTPDGGRVEVSLTQDPTGRSAVLQVADTGLGIPAEDQEAVFGRFFRSSVVQERAIQGSGLGLAIVRTIVESHDGRIGVASAPEQGTTFTVTLPLAPAPQAARGGNPAGATILGAGAVGEG